MACTSLGRDRDICSLIREHSQVSKDLINTADIGIAQRLSAVVNDFLSGLARSFVKENVSRPILFSYSSDGTPVKTRVCVSTSSEQGSIRRSGFRGQEFCVQNVFLLTHRLGQPQMRYLTTNPVLMHHGKGAWNYYQAFRSFCQTPFELGHESICINHYSFDRGIHDSTLRICMANHEKLIADRFQDAGQAHWASLKSWTIGTPCAMHDVQNALSWGLRRHLPGEGGDSGLRDVFAVVEGLRGGYMQLIEKLPFFFRTHVSFCRSTLGDEALRQFWAALHISTDVPLALAKIPNNMVDMLRRGDSSRTVCRRVILK